MGRKIRTVVTMLLLIGILCAGAWYGWTRLSEAGAEFTDDPAAAPSEECTTPDPVTARAGQTVVSVFNAGAPSGTGGQVMDALEARGFQRGALANMPDDVDVDGLEVWSTDIASAEAQLVARQLRRPEMVQRLTTPGSGVNVIVGREFDNLRKAPRRLTVEPEPSC